MANEITYVNGIEKLSDFAASELLAIRAHFKAHPETFEYMDVTTPCNTQGCLAGHVLYRAGRRYSNAGFCGMQVVSPIGEIEFYKTTAEKILGISESLGQRMFIDWDTGDNRDTGGAIRHIDKLLVKHYYDLIELPKGNVYAMSWDIAMDIELAIAQKGLNDKGINFDLSKFLEKNI